MYIPKVLKITDWRNRLLQDRLTLLHDIIKATVINIPFQNITCIGSVDPSQRRAPTFSDALQSGLSGSGGLCGHNNVFMQYTLKSLGYSVNLAAGNFRRTGIPGSHFLCLVKVPYTRPTSKVELAQQHPADAPNSQDNWFIIDVGCSVILHEPIQLSKLPYHGRAGGMDFRYERTADGIQRVNEGGDSLIGPKPKDFLSPQDYTIDLTPKKYFEEFAGPVHQYFINPALPLHHTLFCFRYLSITDTDFEAVWLRGTELILCTKDTRKVTPFKDYYEMHPYVKKYFPMIDPKHVDIAVERFNKCLTEKT